MYIKLNEQRQTIEYPSINKGNVCNYNLATDLLEVDGYVDIEQNLIDLFNQGKGKIVGNSIEDISQAPEYIAEQEAKNNAIIKQDILKQLSEIDAKSIRALRDGDTAYIAQYKAQAQDLREQLNATM